MEKDSVFFGSENPYLSKELLFCLEWVYVNFWEPKKSLNQEPLRVLGGTKHTLTS